MRDQTLAVALATFLIVNSVGSVSAQVVSPELDACRSTGLIALKERQPSIKDVSFDIDGMTIAKANTKVEDTVIKTVVIGDAYLEKGKKDTRRTFLGLIGEKGKFVLTFFTENKWLSNYSESAPVTSAAGKFSEADRFGSRGRRTLLRLSRFLLRVTLILPAHRAAQASAPWHVREHIHPPPAIRKPPRGQLQSNKAERRKMLLHPPRSSLFQGTGIH